MAVPLPRFPQLSRKRAPKMRETTIDPTLRDSYENGMESTRARFTRRRRSFEVSIEFLTPADKRKLENFVEFKAVYGALAFLFHDKSDPAHPVHYRVRFASLPTFSEMGNVEGEQRCNATFSIREV